MFKYLAAAVLTAATLSAGAASAARIQPGSSFTINGSFDYVVPLNPGSVMTVVSVGDPVIAPIGDFAGLDDGSYTAGGDQTLTLAVGPEGFSFSMADGATTFDLLFTQTVQAVLNQFGPLKQPDLDGRLTITSNAYSATPGLFSWAGTTETGSGAGGFSLTIVTTAIPVPAAMPLLIGAIGALGLIRRRA